MHNAPAVAFPMGRSSFQGGLMGLLLGCEMLTFVAWCLVVDALGWPQAFALMAISVTGLWVVWSWWHTPVGTISWDGEVWYVSFNEVPRRVKPEVVFDLQAVVLLRLNGAPTEPVCWAWLERTAKPLRWVALRRAIHGHHRVRSSVIQTELTDLPEPISRHTP